MKDKTTNELQLILNKTKPENIGKYLKDNEDSLYSSDKAFSEFMRSTAVASFTGSWSWNKDSDTIKLAF